ncbi:MAG TPA: serine/threonine-protein kinase, partial [Vicinamibacteria bacterium]|nr:serine/threonine-protein kinase [Vicinamibacteria bacterium]
MLTPALIPAPSIPSPHVRRRPTLIGQTLAHYRVTAAIGAGGMGEVWRATDTKLGREVALKLLPEAFAADPHRLSRFEREAKLLASVNHPAIAHLYGFETALLDNGTKAHVLVMELVEGEDLAGRLKHGKVPVGEAIAIARQVAEALEEAHEKRIVHRDLKPGNVKVTPDSKVKVLDFGLAKAWTGEGAGAMSAADLSQAPTLAHTGTAAGLIVGTTAYMSPEQARGRAVDKRTDIWAFGVVLFEMLTGKGLFEGATVSDVLAAVLTREVDWRALPPETPPNVHRLLRRCLDRDPRTRLRDIGEARVALGLEGLDAAADGRAQGLAPWVAVFGVVLATAAGVVVGRMAPRPEMAQAKPLARF